MKKTGYFFSTFIPILLAICLQFIVVFFLMGCTVMVHRAAGSRAILARLSLMLTDINFTMMSLILFALMNIAVFGFWYYYRYQGDYTPDVRTTFHPALFAGLLLFVPAAHFATGLIVNFVNNLFPHALENYTKMVESSGLQESTNILMLIYAVILGPIGEELIFRGVTLRSARRVLPFWAANLLQALLFGIFHLNLVQSSYAFFLGIVLGLVCKSFGSIYYSIFLHMCFNFFGTVGNTLLSHLDMENPMTLLYYPIILILMVFSVFLFVHGKRALSQRKALSQKKA